MQSSRICLSRFSQELGSGQLDHTYTMILLIPSTTNENCFLPDLLRNPQFDMTCSLVQGGNQIFSSFLDLMLFVVYEQWAHPPTVIGRTKGQCSDCASPSFPRNENRRKSGSTDDVFYA